MVPKRRVQFARFFGRFLKDFRGDIQVCGRGVALVVVCARIELWTLCLVSGMGFFGSIIGQRVPYPTPGNTTSDSPRKGPICDVWKRVTFDATPGT